MNFLYTACADQRSVNIETTRNFLKRLFPKMYVSEAHKGEVPVDGASDGYFFLVMQGIKIIEAIFCGSEFLEKTPSDIIGKLFDDVEFENYIKKNKNNIVLIRSGGLSHIKGIYSERYHDFD